MTEQNIKSRIRLFLNQFFQQHDLKDSDDIFALGFVNSLFAMQLVLFVEQEFGLVIENEDLELDNFRSINALTALIQAKSEPVAAA